MNAIKRVNTFLAKNITKAVGTMWCAYIFTALALISLPAAIRSHDPIIIISWIAQTFLQLVLLSIILVGQDLAAQARKDTHKLIEHHMRESEKRHAEVKALHKKLGTK